MAELKILGAQRVKALIEVLNEKKAKEIEEAKKTLPSRDDIKALVDMEFGIDVDRKRLDELVAQAKEIAARITAVTGTQQDVSLSGWRSTDTDYSKEVDATFKRENTDVLAAIEKRYKELENRLWLCESLEEAKNIVGM